MSKPVHLHASAVTITATEDGQASLSFQTLFGYNLFHRLFSFTYKITALMQGNSSALARNNHVVQRNN